MFYGEQQTLCDMVARLEMEPAEQRRRERRRKVRLVIGCAVCAVALTIVVGFVVWCLRTAPGPFLIGFLAALFAGSISVAAGARR